MKISYLVTCHNETTTLSKLIYKIGVNKPDWAEIVIIDDFSDNPETVNLLKEFDSPSQGWFVYQHAFNNDYSAHKNFGNSKCQGEWIFQLDADELPPETLLGDNLRSIIESNPDMELICVPRINDQRGVTKEDAEEFGWRLVYLPEYEDGKVPLVSWPDYQTRIYKNVPDRIKWKNKLHEVMDGYTQYSALPAELDYAIYHDKTIETARETNRNYKKVFFPV